MLRKTRILLCVLGGTIFGLFLFECLLTIFDLPKPIQIGWRFDGDATEGNEMGFRGQKISYSPQDFVIVLLGDSQVEALGCSYYWMPERCLEKNLQQIASRPIKVFSLAHQGYGQDQELLILREYFTRYRADAVIVWETPNNDIWNNLFITQNLTSLGGPKPTFWLKNGSLCGPTFPKVEGMLVSQKKFRFLALWETYAKSLELTDEYWEKTILPPPYTPLKNFQGVPRNDWEEDCLQPGYEFMNKQISREKNRFAMQLTPPSKRWIYGLELTRALLQQIKQETEKRHGTYMAFYTPPEIICEDGVYTLDGKLYQISLNQYQESVNSMNQGLPVFEIPITTENPRISPHDGHLNQHGVDEAMKTLAQKCAETFFQKK